MISMEEGIVIGRKGIEMEVETEMVQEMEMEAIRLRGRWDGRLSYFF